MRLYPGADYTYQYILDPETGETSTHGIKRLPDSAFIPFVEDNLDYQFYLAWTAEGNTPFPPDPLPDNPVQG